MGNSSKRAATSNNPTAQIESDSFFLLHFFAWSGPTQAIKSTFVDHHFCGPSFRFDVMSPSLFHACARQTPLTRVYTYLFYVSAASVALRDSVAETWDVRRVIALHALLSACLGYHTFDFQSVFKHGQG